MPQRRSVSVTTAQGHHRRSDRGRGHPWRVDLAKVGSGVAAGCSKRDDNVYTEWWALFKSREQFLACSGDHPLRFADPLRFAQLQAEFDHVFDGPR
jgi:hypothetical protein